MSKGFSKKVVKLMLVFLLIYSISCLAIFAVKGSSPDTLTTCIFAFCGAEGGILGFIKVFKVKKGE